MSTSALSGRSLREAANLLRQQHGMPCPLEASCDHATEWECAALFLDTAASEEQDAHQPSTSVPEPVLGETGKAILAVLVTEDADLSRDMHVQTWPQDERDLHRNGTFRSFDERSRALMAYRQRKLAAALERAVTPQR